MRVIWHDLECGSYTADVALWRSLAARHRGPLLEVGAGTGRIALDLARLGHRVYALDRDPVLLAELERRAAGLPLTAVLADAREFELGVRFALILVPMQTIQLLGGPDGRGRFLERARAHVQPGGELAVAISEALELYQLGGGSPLLPPDVCERDGVVYSSRPTAVRADRDGVVLERRRETVTADGRRVIEEDAVHLDRLSAGELEREARAAGLTPAGRTAIPATADHVGSTVVVLRA